MSMAKNDVTDLVLVSPIRAFSVVGNGLWSLKLVEGGRQRNDVPLGGDVGREALDGAGHLVDLGEDDAWGQLSIRQLELRSKWMTLNSRQSKWRKDSHRRRKEDRSDDRRTTLTSWKLRIGILRHVWLDDEDAHLAKPAVCLGLHVAVRGLDEHAVGGGVVLEVLSVRNDVTAGGG